MKTNLNKVLATGGWYSERNCPDSPKRGHHRFKDISSKPGTVRGEKLVTSQCEYCGGLVVDCPTISAF